MILLIITLTLCYATPIITFDLVKYWCNQNSQYGYKADFHGIRDRSIVTYRSSYSVHYTVYSSAICTTQMPFEAFFCLLWCDVMCSVRFFAFYAVGL